MRRLVALLILSYMLVSCGGEKEAPAPTAVTLISPLNNEACTSGALISDTESRVTFTWFAGEHSDSYQLTVINLLNQTQQTQITNTTSLELTVRRNTPYSWYVTSRSSKNPTTVNSPTWKFYNSGPATSSYPPYPAEIVSPAIGQTIFPNNGKINLQWKGSDADNDILNYDVYLGTTINPVIIQSQTTSSSAVGVSVNSNTTYYWKVITRDSKGNTSDSGLFEFRTN